MLTTWEGEKKSKRKKKKKPQILHPFHLYVITYLICESSPTSWLKNLHLPRSWCSLTLKCSFFFFKFTFIFIYNSYGLIVEEFFVRFCSRAIILWWLLFGCTFMILPGKKGINYYMCTGENPRYDLYTTKKVRVIIDKNLHKLQ